MKADPILEEVWRIKDKLSRELAADPDAYFAKLAVLEKAEDSVPCMATDICSCGDTFKVLL